MLAMTPIDNIFLMFSIVRVVTSGKLASTKLFLFALLLGQR
jgi:hypothetical protein